MRNLEITSYDYHETTKGGVSVYDDIFKFHTNGSVKAVINLPDQQLL